MRKSITSVMAAALPAALVISALGITSANAAAGDPTTVVRSSDDIAASGLTMYNKAKSNADLATGSFSFVSGPLTAPSGSGSLQISVGSDPGTQGNGGVGLCDGAMFNFDLSQYFASGNPADVIYFPVTYKPAALNLSFDALASDFPVTVGLTLWRGSLPVSLSAQLDQNAAWQSFNVRTAQFFDPTDPATTKLLKDWVEAGDSVAGVCIGTDKSNAASIAADEKFNIDNVVYGLTGYNWDPGTDATPPQTDFEPTSSAPSVTQTTSSLTVNAGTATSLSVTVKKGATAVEAASVRLWAKPYGASSFSPVASAATNASGVASVSVKPTKNTVYMWGYDGVGNFTEASPVTSATRTINAKIVIKAKPVSSSFSSAAKLVVTGSVSPVKSGAKVSIYIKKSTATSYSLAGTATVTSTGAFVYSKSLTRGSYKVYAKIGSQTGNIGASSTAFSISVS